jgi:Tfp pilus assembly protein PilF
VENVAYQRACVLYDQRRYDLAEAVFRRALEAEPDNGDIHSFLALCLCFNGSGERAISEAYRTEEAIRETIRLVQRCNEL